MKCEPSNTFNDLLVKIGTYSDSPRVASVLICKYRLYNEVEVSTGYTLPKGCRPEVVYTEETDTELYNQLVL